MGFLYRYRVAFGFCCVLLAVALTFAVCFFALARTTADAFRLTVVIDAGHGGVDGGVSGIETGARESDVNLAISRKLQARMEEAGFSVVMTRNTEAGLYGAATPGYKRRDMQKRAEIINGAYPALVISIHQNFFSDRARRGAQVFFKGEGEGKSLACAIQSSLNSMKECVKQTQPLKGDYFILNCNPYPSVIVECGFLSNADDERLLLLEDYQHKIVEAILTGALSYLSSSVSADK